MTRNMAVEKLLESFDCLSDTEKQEMLIGLLQRHRYLEFNFGTRATQATVSIRRRRADPEQFEIVFRLDEDLAWAALEEEEIVFEIKEFSLELGPSESEPPESGPQRLTRIMRPRRKRP